MTKDDYLARVPNIAEREEVARLYEAYIAAKEVYDDSTPMRLAPDQVAALEAIDADYEQKRQDLTTWYDAARDAVIGADPRTDLRKARDDAAAAYDQSPGDAIEANHDDTVIRCALSGAPIYESDTTVEFGDKVILACVLLSPEQIAALSEDDEDCDDEALESEAAA